MSSLVLMVAVCVLAGCNARNCEYKRWDAQGNLVEQVRMGQVNFMYWFGMKDFAVDSNPIRVSVGEIQERNDPNAPAVALEVLKLASPAPQIIR